MVWRHPGCGIAKVVRSSFGGWLLGAVRYTTRMRCDAMRYFEANTMRLSLSYLRPIGTSLFESDVLEGLLNMHPASFPGRLPTILTSNFHAHRDVVLYITSL